MQLVKDLELYNSYKHAPQSVKDIDTRGVKLLTPTYKQQQLIEDVINSYYNSRNSISKPNLNTKVILLIKLDNSY